MSDSPAAHVTVLLHEAVDALVIDPDGFYIDGTFGRGGHSQLILERLSPQGRLLAIDKDPQAVATGREKFARDERFEIAQGSFTQLEELVAERGRSGEVAGVLVDLGVSSPQLDEAQRGFSFMQDGPLDMRMDTTQGQSAADWISTAKDTELAKILKEYGEEKFAKRIARAIVTAREETPIVRTLQLAKIIADAHPSWEVGKHPATRSFLAIRLFINKELEDLRDLLEQITGALKPGGRLVAISFHSLEDRIVKRFMRDKAKGDNLPRNVPVLESQLNKTLRIIGKATKPSDQEIAINVRSRSAVMRVAEKL
ncbi:16S rRNA (cytosine(1402)-N(4))-methyltransferase RsmH [Aurantivibrio plasticivorans]